MNLKWWKNKEKKKLVFQKKLESEGTERRRNPARGWYSIYTFPVQDPIDPEELRWSLREQEQIALVRISLQAYRMQPLDLSALENVRQILLFFREYGKDVILRPAYDFEGKGKQSEPEEISILLEHICQISHLLQETRHSVILWQGLLIGSWGEMHDSSYLSREKLRMLWNCLREELGNQIPVAVRTPALWRTLVDERDYERAKETLRLTLFDDAIFGSSTHLGTFGTQLREAAGWESPWMREEELQFEERITDRLPCGGEVLLSDHLEQDVDGIDPVKITSLFQRMHLTYLNQAYDRRLLDQWKKIPAAESGVWADQGFYDYVGEHLGYRFFVQEVCAEETRRWKKGSLRICLCNQGFTRCMDSFDLSIKINGENPQEICTFPVSYDLRRLGAGERVWIEFPLPDMEGQVTLSAKRKKDQKPLFWANKGAEPEVLLGILREE